MSPHRCRAVRTLAPVALAAAGLLLKSRSAAADTVPIEVVAREQNRIMLDGILGDWRRFTQLIAVDESPQVLTGNSNWHGSDDASFAFALARDESLLFFAAEVHDDTVVRTREHRTTDDALILSLGVPGAGNRAAGYDIVVYPGDPGNYPGQVRFRGARSGVVAGAQVVEAPLRNGSGFTIEVSIPWRAMPEILAGIASVRGRVAYQDADTNVRPNVDSLLASGPGDGQHPNDLPAAAGAQDAAGTDLIAQFAQSHGLAGTQPLLDRQANIAGDAAVERIVVFPQYAVASGPGIAGGTRYAFIEYPMRTRDDLVDTALRDLTGDGRLDLVLRVRVPGDNGLVREVLYIYGSPNGGDSIGRIFAAETGRAQGANRVTNRATFENGNGGIRITFASAAGYTQATYPRMVENGVAPALTPWSEHRAIVHRWSDGVQRFEVANAEPNPNARDTGAPAAIPGTPSPVMTEAPADVDAVMRAFRQSRGIADGARPAFAAQGNMAGDATAENVQIYGRMLVVTGPRFMNGRSYFNIELPANADSDVLGLELGDVTDDGHLEAMVRVRRSSPVQVNGMQLEVVKEFLLVYSVEDTHRGRVFAAEISRRVGNDVITNAVQPVRRGRNNELSIDPGRATGGWNEHTYPFRDLPMQGFAPILVPWVTPRRVTYRWNGTALGAMP